MSDDKETYLLIDGSNAFFRAYINTPTLDENGRAVGGIHGFLRILQKMVKEHQPDHVSIYWDSEGGSKRKRSIFKDYKEGRSLSLSSLNRPYDPESLERTEEKENRYWQYIRTIEYLNKMPIKQYKIDNIEADDLLAYCLSIEPYKDSHCIIVSDDKDFLQLVSEDVVLYRPYTGNYLNSEDVNEKFGVHPNNLALARALAGDASDNLDGVHMMGLKTVSSDYPLLSEPECQGFEYIFERSNEVLEESNSVVHQRVLDSEDKIKRNYKIMQLYEPMISPDRKDEVREIAKNEGGYTFEKIEVINMMKEDDILDHYWDDLFSYMRRIILSSEA